jgi:glycosyltransferase involved in cell wall biosynthesis
MNSRAVYVGTHAWGSPIRVGSHHLARQLATQHEVLYLSHPITLSSIFSPADNQLKIRARLLREGISSRYTPTSVREMNWFMPFAPGPSGFHRSNICVNYGSKVCLPNPRRILRDNGFLKPDVLWLDSLFQSFWVDIFEPQKLCVRVADHPEHIAALSGPLQRAFYSALERASLIITPANSTAEYLEQITSKPVKVVPNGVETAHFKRETSTPLEYQGDAKPKVVFVGALANWIDIELIATTAARCPLVSFYLIGPSHNLDLGALPENVSYLGGKPYSEIPGYLQHADVAIAPFDVKRFPDFIESIDAIKLYEYIAAGIPTIATRWSQSVSLEPFVITAEQTAEEFAKCIEHAIAHPEQYQAPADVIAKLDWSERLKDVDVLG